MKWNNDQTFILLGQERSNIFDYRSHWMLLNKHLLIRVCGFNMTGSLHTFRPSSRPEWQTVPSPIHDTDCSEFIIKRSRFLSLKSSIIFRSWPCYKRTRRRRQAFVSIRPAGTAKFRFIQRANIKPTLASSTWRFVGPEGFFPYPTQKGSTQCACLDIEHNLTHTTIYYSRISSLCPPSLLSLPMCSSL